jgi:hypothetical protein
MGGFPTEVRKLSQDPSTDFDSTVLSGVTGGKLRSGARELARSFPHRTEKDRIASSYSAETLGQRKGRYKGFRCGPGDFPEGIEPAVFDGLPALERCQKRDSSRRVPGPNSKTEIPRSSDPSCSVFFWQVLLRQIAASLPLPQFGGPAVCGLPFDASPLNYQTCCRKIGLSLEEDESPSKLSSFQIVSRWMDNVVRRTQGGHMVTTCAHPTIHLLLKYPKSRTVLGPTPGTRNFPKIGSSITAGSGTRNVGRDSPGGAPQVLL